jgi:cell division control protein 6
MAKFEFTPTGDIFRKREALSEEYIPDELVGRDEELTQFFQTLQPVIENENPSNILLYGKSGVGKTASTQYMLKQLKSDSESVDDLELYIVDINCEDYHTSYQAGIKIVNELREQQRERHEDDEDEDAEGDDQLPATGYPQSKVMDFLTETIDDTGGTVLVVLDEIHALDDDQLIYRLTRAREEGAITNAYLGTIGISNDLKYRDKLRQKVKSSLCEKTVLFSPYDADELQKVLRQRVETAFYDDVVDESAITRCAAYGARNSGDARLALDVLQQSGDLARSENAETLVDEHVEKARSQIERDRVLDVVRNYTEHGKYVLLALLTLAEENETPASTLDVIDEYQSICQREATDPVSERSVRVYLSELKQLSIIGMEKKRVPAKKGGLRNTYSVVGEVEQLKETLLESWE